MNKEFVKAALDKWKDDELQKVHLCAKHEHVALVPRNRTTPDQEDYEDREKYKEDWLKWYQAETKGMERTGLLSCGCGITDDWVFSQQRHGLNELSTFVRIMEHTDFI